MKTKKICLACSAGGHLTEILIIKRYLGIKKNFFFIINKKIKFKENKVYYVSHGIINFNLLKNFYEIFKIFLKEKPKIIISTGASIAFPVAIVGKYFFNTKIIFIETVTRVKKPSRTGKILYWISDTFFFQWKELKKFYPKGILLNVLDLI
jgi:UDP-N-acetylglucosamine:LPS N-acetylglucosamine transferase